VSGDRQARQRLQIDPASEKTRQRDNTEARHDTRRALPVSDPPLADAQFVSFFCDAAERERPLPVSLPASPLRPLMVDAELLFHFNSVFTSHDSRLHINFTCTNGLSDYLY